MNTDDRKNVGGRNFGEGLKVSIFACRGASNEALCNEINQRILSTIRMNSGGMSPKCWEFPTEEGKGGSGITLVQPLVESFIIWDTWVDNDGAFCFVVSCKEYDSDIVENILGEYFEVSQRDVVITQL